MSIKGQKAGTSGLRKPVKEVKTAHYLENFVQAIFDALPANELKGSTLVLSGDGRYHNSEAIVMILRMCAAHGIGRVLLGQGGIMSTPCVSAVIRSYKAYGGIILTASHNPGGPDADFGIKYNTQNGGPATEALTDIIYKNTLNITQYKIAKETPQFDMSAVGVYHFGAMTLEVIDAAAFYAARMAEIFDFKALKELIARPDFRFVYDCMHGVAGPFAKEIFIKQLGAHTSAVLNATPSPDFNGGHPDPNLTYASELVSLLGLQADGSLKPAEKQQQDQQTLPADLKSYLGGKIPDFGAAADGDADRNMILGSGFFVTPSDSVAIISSYVAEKGIIPYFQKHKAANPRQLSLKGVARSMPTSQALDRVAKTLNIPCYEVPTGWKFFGNLMDAGLLSICGEESFGTGSDHIREKDGIWAVLAWLSILQFENQSTSSGSLVTIQDIVHRHWTRFGRNFYCRYDYESVDSDGANKLMQSLISSFSASKGVEWCPGCVVSHADEFSYHDPVDGSVSAHQGVRFLFEDGSRVVFRLSGTGSVGATIRMYIEKYEADASKILMDSKAALAPLIQSAIRIAKIEEFTGRKEPTVIT